MDSNIEFFNSAHGRMEPHNIIIAIFIYVTFISAQVTTCQVTTTCAIHRITKNNSVSSSRSVGIDYRWTIEVQKVDS